MLALLKLHESTIFMIVKKLIYVSTTAPQRSDSSSHITNCRMMPCCSLSRPDTLQAPSQVQASECSVCRAGCTTDNNAASRSLSHKHTHIPVGLVVVVDGGGGLSSGAQQALSTSSPNSISLKRPPTPNTHTTSFSHTRTRAGRPS